MSERTVSISDVIATMTKEKEQALREQKEELEYWKKLAKSRERLYSKQLNQLRKTRGQALREQRKDFFKRVDLILNIADEQEMFNAFAKFKEEMGVL